MNYILHYNGEIEVFNVVRKNEPKETKVQQEERKSIHTLQLLQFHKKLKELSDDGIEFYFQINSGLGCEYFTNETEFRLGLKNCHAQGYKPYPLYKCGNKGFVNKTLYKKLTQNVG